MTRRSLAAPLVGTKPRAHGEQSALPLASRPRTLPRPPQARRANVTTPRWPLKDEPGCATHTPFPNFGKVEYFFPRGLTHGRHRPRNETPRVEATRGGAKHRPLLLLHEASHCAACVARASIPSERNILLYRNSEMAYVSRIPAHP